MNGFYMSIPAGMLFRRFWCGQCGTQLKRVSEKKNLIRGDDGFDEAERFLRRRVQGGKIRVYVNPMNEITVKEFRFICPACNRSTDYETQKIIAMKQKQCGHKIVDE